MELFGFLPFWKIKSRLFNRFPPSQPSMALLNLNALEQFRLLIYSFIKCTEVKIAIYSFSFHFFPLSKKNTGFG